MASKTTQSGRCTSQEHSQTKVPQGRSGRRKLDFGSQQFRGKSFFLDLSGYRHSAKVESELVARGGTIEVSFKKGVRYLVTSRPRQKSQTPSTPSPGTPTTAHSAKSNVSQIVSPLTESPGSVEGRPKQQPPAYATRAQKLVQMSLEKQKNTAKLDIIAVANEWKCKVIYLDDLLAELKKLRPLPQKDAQMSSTHPSRQAKVRSLRVPFLKVEDISRAHRPLIYEAKRWPIPDPLCSPKACPFDSPKHTRTNPHRGDDTPQPAPEARDPRPGYCECCATRYNDLNLHLGSARHREYAANDSNFATLDSLIAQGTSFSQFITQLRAKKRAGPQNCADSGTPKGCRQRKPSPQKNSAKRNWKSPVKSPRKKSPVKPSPRKDVVVLVTPPSSIQDLPDSKLGRFAEAPHTPSPTQSAAPKSPRTAKRVAKKPSPCKSPLSTKSPDKIISLPQAMAQKSPSPPKLGALCLIPVADTSGKMDTAVPAAAKTPTRTKTAAASKTLVDVLQAAPLAPTSKKYRKKALRIDQIADKLSQRASGSSVGERSELSQKRPLEEDLATTTICAPSSKWLRLSAESPVLRQRGDQPTAKTPEKQETETRAAGLRTSSPRKPNHNSDDLIPETPEKEAAVLERGKTSVLCNIQTLLEQVNVRTEGRPAVGAKNSGLHTPSKVNSPIRKRSPQGNMSPEVRKSPRLAQRELERTRPRVSTKTECIRRFRPPRQDSLVVSFDLRAITLGAEKRTFKLPVNLVCGALETTPTRFPVHWTPTNITPEIGLQGVLPLKTESPLLGVSSELGSDLVGFSPNTVKMALPNFLAKSACVVTRSMVKAEPEGDVSGVRKIEEIAPRLIAGAESKTQSESEGTVNRKRCLEFDDSCSSPPAKKRRANPVTSSPPMESRQSPRLQQLAFTRDSLCIQ